MKKLALLLFCLLACAVAPAANAQGVHYNDIARTKDNRPLSNGSVAVCVANPTSPGNPGEPCFPLAPIYQDSALSIPMANPIPADINGNFSFWAAPGTYFLEFYSPQQALAPFTETITLPCVPYSGSAGCGVTGVSVKAFGAKCDDVTDDTAAIQAAINSLPNGPAVIGGTVELQGVCKTTAGLVVTTPNVTLTGTGHFQFITQNLPPSYIDFQATAAANAITVNAQGFAMKELGVKYPTTIGGPMSPPATPVLSQVTGTGCPAEPYYVELTYVNPQGQTTISPEATITTTSGNCLQVASPVASGNATGYNVWASANPNNETLQNSKAIAIGTSWTFGGTLINLSYRPLANTTSYAAISDNNGGQYDGVKLFTNDSATVGTASVGNGFQNFGCCSRLHNVHISGFGIGVEGAGANNDYFVEDSYIQDNNIGAYFSGGADIAIISTDFEGNGAGNLKAVYGAPYTIDHDYFEEPSGPTGFVVQLGDTTLPPQGTNSPPVLPQNVHITNSFFQCGLSTYPPAPIELQTAETVLIANNQFSQCGAQNVIHNTAGANAHITILNNNADTQPLSWITSMTGVVESDFNGVQKLPSLRTVAGFSSGLESVTQSGGSAAFDASQGNNFAITLSANITSSTLSNAQPGQWLEFTICQPASGGPFTFTWPTNVVGGGTIGTTAGDCSTQAFVFSNGNAEAVGPMTQNIATGTSGLSVPAVSGTIPYFTSTWTNADCLQAGSSLGLINLATCSTGAGAFAGGLGSSFQDAAEIAAPANPASGDDRLYLNSTTHQLTCLTSSGGNCLSSASGMSNPMTTLGDMIYENSSPTAARLPGNTSSALNILTQTGTGSASAAPAWAGLAFLSIPTQTGSITTGDCVKWASATSITDQGAACGSGGSGLFSSFQFGTNSAITTSGTFFQLTAGTNITLGTCTGSGTSASPFQCPITASSTGATAWSAITGSATNTNTGFTLAPTATGTVPWTLNCPSGITVDCVDWEINGSKALWIDSTGAVHVGGTGAAYTAYTCGTIPTPASGVIDLGCNGSGFPAWVDATGTARPLASLEGDLNGGTSSSPQVTGAHFTSEVELGNQAVTTSVPNDTTTGTFLNGTAKISSGALAIACGPGDTGVLCFPVVSPTATSGNARLARNGEASVIMDGAITAGDWIVESVTQAHEAHDAGASLPAAGVCIVGVALVTNASPGSTPQQILVQPFCR